MLIPALKIAIDIFKNLKAPSNKPKLILIIQEVISNSCLNFDLENPLERMFQGHLYYGKNIHSQSFENKPKVNIVLKGVNKYESYAYN